MASKDTAKKSATAASAPEGSALKLHHLRPAPGAKVQMEEGGGRSRATIELEHVTTERGGDAK